MSVIMRKNQQYQPSSAGKADVQIFILITYVNLFNFVLFDLSVNIR